MARPAQVAVDSFLIALLVAGHLTAGKATDAATGSAKDIVQDGSKLREVRRRNLLRDGRSTYNDPVVKPQRNDSVTDAYWAKVNKLIRSEIRKRPPQLNMNDKMTTKRPPPPLKQIFTATKPRDVLDTPAVVAKLNHWEFATPRPLGRAATGPEFEGQMGLVPYDMQLGSRIMYSLTDRSREKQPPTQRWVDQAFIAQCPMVMIGDSVFIRPPTCGNMGDWVDLANKRAILRWEPTSTGGVYFGVDSTVSGAGSVLFAEIHESVSFNKYIFHLSNCVRVHRYVIEEQIIKVYRMAPKAWTTYLEHDQEKSGVAFFYKYIIKSPNGTAVAKTSLFRMDQNEMNFTIYEEGENEGPVIAMATRAGVWKKKEWRSCAHERRGWDLTFLTDEVVSSTMATVQDLRVAAAATITLMAFRDETTGRDGFQHAGQNSLYWAISKIVIAVLFVMLVVAIIYIVLAKRSPGRKLQRFCFHLENVIMPKCPVTVREPILNPSY